MTREPWALTLLLFLAFPLGLALTRGLLPARSQIARLGTATLAGLGVLTAAAQALLCLGVPGRIGIPVVAGAGLAAGIALLLFERRRSGAARESGARRSIPAALLVEILPVILVPGLLAASFDHTRTFAVCEHDAIHIWVPKAVRVLDEAPPDLVTEAGNDHPEYPRGLAILTAAVAAPLGQVEPRLPRTVPLFLFALLLLCVYDALTARGNLVGAVAAVVILGCLPLVVRHAASGLADGPVSAFIALGCVGLAPQRDGRPAIMTALAGGLGAMALKDEGFVFCGALVLVLCARLLRSGRAWQALAAAGVAGAFAAPWIVLRSTPKTGSPLLWQAAPQNLGLVLIRFDLMVRELLHLALGFPDPSPRGFALPDVVPGGDAALHAAILCGLVLLIGSRPRFPVLPLGILLAVDFVVILLSHIPVDWQLITATNRLVLQVLPALVLAAVDKLTRADEEAAGASARTPALA